MHDTLREREREREMMTRPESDPRRARPRQRARVPLRKLLRVASVASGIQFGWALQLSLLTPYVQQLGIPHAWASAVWLCGPLSRLLVQPLVGHLSDRCTSRFGRRRPFISAGAASIVAAVVIIGYYADIGWLLGDREGSRKGAIGAFVVGFWLLDVANNVTQGPCRALLADLTGKDHRRNRVANAYFSLFMAVGNVLGFATGSYNGCCGVTSVLLEKLCRKLGTGVVWGISNILMSLCFVSMLIISYVAKNVNKTGDNGPPDGVVAAALLVFAILGIPLAITYSVPYALISSHIEPLGLGQGLSMGVLNLAIVIPQMVVSIGSGPLDQLFGGGNSPALAVAAVAAFTSGLIAILSIPRTGAKKSRIRK
ncbi:Sucrose transport protein [Actinidia chinensis var. chinensis]|uniref:Sucrose transport protein n=1 Tax=Actinidia chinensis var. chinensis TaxID=1590841 RepID=A0A2R6R3A7_ACTCC|nr:Sucrose transport protein [Actinidia chinensis var. chinensis]